MTGWVLATVLALTAWSALGLGGLIGFLAAKVSERNVVPAVWQPPEPRARKRDHLRLMADG